jgi:hypothetical protein
MSSRGTRPTTCSPRRVPLLGLLAELGSQHALEERDQANPLG